jgi:hypothetical protein
MRRFSKDKAKQRGDRTMNTEQPVPCGISQAEWRDGALLIRGWCASGEDGLLSRIRLADGQQQEVPFTGKRPDIAKKYSLPIERPLGFEIAIPMGKPRQTVDYEVEFLAGELVIGSRKGAVDAPKDSKAPCGISEFVYDGRTVMIRSWCAFAANKPLCAEFKVANAKESAAVDMPRPDIAKKFGLPKERPYGVTVFLDVGKLPERSFPCRVTFREGKEIVSELDIDPEKYLPTNRNPSEPDQGGSRANVENAKTPQAQKLNLLSPGPSAYRAPWLLRLFPSYGEALNKLNGEISDLECLVASLAEENVRYLDELAGSRAQATFHNAPPAPFGTLLKIMESSQVADAPSGGMVETGIDDDGRILVSGWCLDARGKGPCRAVVVFDEGDLILQIVPSIPRPDEGKALGLANVNIGFEVVITKKPVGALTAFAIDHSGAVIRLDSRKDSGSGP